MTTCLMYAMALGAVLGGMDYMLGNRFGLGQRFEEAFRLLGSIALSMAGILCLGPVLSRLLRGIVVPVCSAIGIDPGIVGSILAIDMGGYQMAMDLAQDAAFGKFAGIIVSAIFGCTVVFTIPVGLGTVGESDRPYFTRGILLGLATMPVGIFFGGVLCGLSLGDILRNCLPVFLISALLLLGLKKWPEGMLRLFQKFAKAVQMLAILGLTLGAAAHMTGLAILPEMTALSDAMEVVCSIAIVMLGSMPLAELIQRLLRKPFAWVGAHTGLNEVSTTGVLIGMVSVVPALAMIPRMDRRGKVVCGAFVVCGASTFAAHLGFTLSTEPQLASALLGAKLLGGAVGVAAALIATKKDKNGPQETAAPVK